jgi:hypothetical protein
MHSNNTKRPTLGFNSTKQIHAFSNETNLQGYDQTIQHNLNISNFMANTIPGQPETIYGGGGIVDNSGLGGETRDSVMLIYN